MIKCLFGRRELGKTTLACHLASEKRPQLIFDPRAQFSGPNQFSTVDPELILFLLEDGQDVIVQPRELQASADALAWSAERYIIDGPASRQLVVLFDEIDDQKLYNVNAWSYLLRTCPRDRVDFIFTAHRPKNVSTDVRAIADDWYLFRTVQRHDLDAIRDLCGDDVEREVQRIQPHQYIRWNNARGIASENRTPATWFTRLELV